MRCACAWHAVALLALLAIGCGRTTDPPPDGARDVKKPVDQGVETINGDSLPGEAMSNGEVTQGDQGSRICPMECIRVIICCRGDCSGPVVSTGCCSCQAGEVDSLSCPAERRCG